MPVDMKICAFNVEQVMHLSAASNVSVMNYSAHPASYPITNAPHFISFRCVAQVFLATENDASFAEMERILL
jgi:hypothetical protein